MVLEAWIPVEKQKSPAIEAESGSGGEGSFGIEIEGLDISRGISYSGGTKEYYIETLETFYEDGLQRIEQIKESLVANDLSLYATLVHALKSAIASIGSAQMSQAAYELEKAAKGSDADFINKNNEAFLDDLSLLLRRINKAVTEYNNVNRAAQTDSDSGDSERFKSELGKLKTALDNMDAGVIYPTIDNLLKIAYTDEAVTAVKNISGKIMLAEFDEASVLAETLMREV
jgi:HPt (histidine-containing phosphotransfer) domain-containing protein